MTATAGAPGTSTAVRITRAAGTPATAETITIAGTQGKPTAAITSETAVTIATAEAAGLLWDVNNNRDGHQQQQRHK